MSEFCFQTFVEFAGSAQIIANKRCKVAHPRLAAPWHPHHSSTSPVLVNLLLSRTLAISYTYSNEIWSRTTGWQRCKWWQATCKTLVKWKNYLGVLQSSQGRFGPKRKARKSLSAAVCMWPLQKSGYQSATCLFLDKRATSVGLRWHQRVISTVGPRKRCRKRAMAFPDTMQKIVQENK